MKLKITAVILAAVLLLGAGGCAADRAEQANAAPNSAPEDGAAGSIPDIADDGLSDDIIILYTNDVHCGIEDDIGYAGLAAFKNEMKKTHRYVLLADCGDHIEYPSENQPAAQKKHRQRQKLVRLNLIFVEQLLNQRILILIRVGV